MTQDVGTLPNKRYTVAVVGAGIVGVSTAIWLQRAGHDVVVIDRTGPGREASYGNGGILASCSVVPVTTPGLLGKAPRLVFDPTQPLFLKWSYVPRLLPWLVHYLSHANPVDAGRIAAALYPIVGDSLADHRALAQGTPAADWIVPSDYLYLYGDRAAFEADAFGWSLRKAHGFTWDELDGPALKAYDAVLENFGFAVRLGEHGYIADPGRYVEHLAAHVVADGGRLLCAEVSDIVSEAGRVIGVRAGGETIACQAAVIAAGVWSVNLTRRLGLTVPLESERGYHLELWAPSVTPRAPIMVAARKFVVTPLRGRLRLAGVVEFGGLDAPPSQAPVGLLKNNIRAALPGLTWEEETEWMGHRPAPVDSIPVIGPVPGVDGAYLAFGHHHVGLTGGPKTGRLLAQLISGHTPDIDLAPYDPGRFR